MMELPTIVFSDADEITLRNLDGTTIDGEADEDR
jgi:hypothetical protein